MSGSESPECAVPQPPAVFYTVHPTASLSGGSSMLQRSEGFKQLSPSSSATMRDTVSAGGLTASSFPSRGQMNASTHMEDGPLFGFQSWMHPSIHAAPSSSSRYRDGSTGVMSSNASSSLMRSIFYIPITESNYAPPKSPAPSVAVSRSAGFHTPSPSPVRPMQDQTTQTELATKA